MADSVRDDIEAAADDGGATDDKALVSYWQTEIASAVRMHKSWHQQGDKIIDRYLDERGESTDRDLVKTQRRMNILWSNVETLKPTVLAKPPQPNVSRANKDKDPVGRWASIVLQRSLAAQLRDDTFMEALKYCVADLLLPGRGVCFVNYDCDIEGGEPDEDGQAEQETVVNQRVCVDYVHWKDFFTNRARNWGEVWYVVKQAFLTRRELRKKYGKKIADLVPLDHKPEELKGSRVDTEQFSKATVWQIWDSKTRKVVEIAKEYKDAPLAVRDPPVEFDKFFPCPRPISATLGGKSMIPTPDYVEYQDQAEEIDMMTNRIFGLTRSLRLRGVYDASFSGLEKVFNDANDNELVPVESFALFGEKGGMAGVISWVSLKEVAEALRQCMQARDDAKQAMYEVTGISDIVRGATAASETATAQQLKSQWGSVRIRMRQQDVARFARDIIRLMAEVIAEQFSQETLAAMSNVKLLTQAQKQAVQAWQQMIQQRQAQAQMQAMAQQGQGGPPGQPGQPPAPMGPPPQQAPMPPPPVPPDLMAAMDEPTWDEVMKLLRDDTLRSFVIDVETDSTIEPDQQAERDSSTQFVTAITQFLMAGEKILMSAPQLAPLVGELLLFSVRRWKVGETMESKIEEAVEFMAKAAAAPRPPDPKAQAATVTAQAKMITAQATAQGAQAKTAVEAQRTQSETASDQGWQQIEAAKLQDATAQRAHEAQAGAADRIHGAHAAALDRQHEAMGEAVQRAHEAAMLAAQPKPAPGAQ